LFCSTKFNKDTKKHLVGQPVSNEVMKILPREQFDLLTMQCDCNRYFETSKDNSLLLFDNAYPYYSSLLNGFGKVSMFPFHHF